jgi:hypothetical protein
LIILYLTAGLKGVHAGDRVLVWVALASVPFLFVRLLYLVLIAFDSKNPDFDVSSPNVYIQAFMQIFMEFIVFALYVTGGLIAPKMAKGEYAGDGPELHANKNNDPVASSRYRGQDSGFARGSEV